MDKDDLLKAAVVCDRATPDLEGVPGIDFLHACATEALQLAPTLPRRCVGCAYSPGTEANGTPTTRQAAKECVERSHPFWCHLVSDGLGEQTHLCAGWAAALRARASQEGVR